MSLYESRALSKPLRDEVLQARHAYEQLWAKVLADGSDDGVFKPVSPLVLRGILGLLNSTFLWLDPTGPTAPDDAADIYLDLLLDGLRPRPQG